MKRHLQEARASQSVLDYAQGLSRRAGVRAFRAVRGILREAWCVTGADVIWRIIEKWIEPHVVIRRVKARMVEEIECLHVKTQFEAFCYAEIFENGHVHA